MLHILVTLVFLLPSGDAVTRSAPLFAVGYPTRQECAARVNGLGLGAKARVAGIVSRLRPDGALVESIQIACKPD